MSPVGTAALPPVKAVRDLFVVASGSDDVTVAPGEPVTLSSFTGAYVAVFVTAHLRTGALVVLDLPLAAIAGGAVELVPPVSVREAVAARELPGLIQSGLERFVEAAAGWFDDCGLGQLRLYQLVGPDGSVPRDVAALTSAIGRRRDLTVRVPGYGRGRLSVVLAP